MSDGDVLIDDDREFPDGTRATLYAVENSDYPDGVNYRFAHYDPNAGRGILRFDNSQVPRHGAGVHHRHKLVDGQEHMAEIEFVDLETHLTQFKNEVTTNAPK